MSGVSVIKYTPMYHDSTILIKEFMEFSDMSIWVAFSHRNIYIH